MHPTGRARAGRRNLYLVNLKRTPTWGRLVIEYFGDDALRILGRAHGE